MRALDKICPNNCVDVNFICKIPSSSTKWVHIYCSQTKQYREKLLQSWDSNPGQLGEKHECYLWAMPFIYFCKKVQIFKRLILPLSKSYFCRGMILSRLIV